MDIHQSCQDTVPPYLLVDKEYECLNWIMTPFTNEGIHCLSFTGMHYDKLYWKERLVIENAFGLLKMN